jgi:hypothetical protein
LVIAALLGITVAQATGLSLLDKIAQYAGQVLGNRTYEDIKGDLLQQIEENIGAMPGNSIQGPDWTVNGYQELSYNVPMGQATTTPCRFKPSTTATSTLTYGLVQFDYASTTDMQIQIAKTTNALSYASTTAIGTLYVLPGLGGLWADSGAGLIVASTTPTTKPVVFAPGEWLIVKFGGDKLGYATNAAMLAPVGRCNFKFTLTAK